MSDNKDPVYSASRPTRTGRYLERTDPATGETVRIASFYEAGDRDLDAIVMLINTLPDVFEKQDDALVKIGKRLDDLESFLRGELGPGWETIGPIPEMDTVAGAHSQKRGDS